MKKFMPVICAVLVGGVCAIFLFRRIENVNSLSYDGNATAVQIGVFTKRENADNMAIKYGGVVIEDEGLFRVYYSVLSKDENLDYITSVLKGKGINYYLKRVTLTKPVLEELEKYESLMIKTGGEAKDEINSQVLKIYEDYS